MQNDTSSSLSVIRKKSNTGLISRLIDIQKHDTLGEKSYEWAMNLQCLYTVESNQERCLGLDGPYNVTPAKILQRTQIAMHQKNYVAVSYTWQPSSNEDSVTGGYLIQSTRPEEYKASKVRDVVLDRVISYATHFGVRLFWTDSECIDQDDHDQKKIAIQSMDLVYSRSEYPLGLLSVRLDSPEQLDLLLGLLEGQFLKAQSTQSYPMLNWWIDGETASKVLNLLCLITSDRWWNRAWIFQEDYRASTKMTLLIRTSARRSHAVQEKLGQIPGELQVKSAQFREAATLFCLAYTRKVDNKQDKDRCGRVLERAKKYNILYKYGKMGEGMSPTIFRDIGNRGITEPSDLLAIAANCCYYSIRLDTQALSAAGCSLSLCILALCLLNGEIIKNGERDKGVLSSNIFKFLKDQSLDFKPPVEERELTFIKHCRLADVRLCKDGIMTSGYLWKVYKEIDPHNFTTWYKHDREIFDTGLNGYQRSRLLQLAKEMELMGYREFSRDLKDYLDEDANSDEGEYPSKRYKDYMAEQVVRAMKEHRPFYLGCLLGENPYRGIFIPEPDWKRNLGEFYAFTSWSCAKDIVDGKPTERNIDKFVSLEVEIDGCTSHGLPRLTTKRWMNGLCFFRRSSQNDVVFSWPPYLKY